MEGEGANAAMQSEVPVPLTGAGPAQLAQRADAGSTGFKWRRKGRQCEILATLAGRAAVAACILHGAGVAAASLPPGSYGITTETDMPHLTENLRYATTHERRCLVSQPLSVLFPILNHPSLAGCRLVEDGGEEGGASYALTCEGSDGKVSNTTGRARWRLAAGESVGLLTVKLGGKNMTFSQRVTARYLGECASSID